MQLHQAQLQSDSPGGIRFSKFQVWTLLADGQLQSLLSDFLVLYAITHSVGFSGAKPGIYVLSGDVDVCADVCRHSAKVGRLLGGREVPILEVQHREGDKRVRGRVALEGLEGWISLLDMGTGHRWAHRQLGATTDWIRDLVGTWEKGETT